METKETRIYLVNSETGFDFYNSTEEQIIDQAEQEGTVYSLEGFQKAFNNEEISELSFMLIKQPEQQQLKKTQVGCISVDAGLVMVGDPCYHIGQDKQPKSFNKTWQEFVREELTYQDEPLNEVQLYHDSNAVGLAVVIGNFGGDGCYPVYVETNEQGQQKRLIVEF